MTSDLHANRGSSDTPLEDVLERVRQISAENEKLAGRLADGEYRFRHLAKGVWRVQEEERRSIALELHDGLGQLLTALINHLQHSRAEREPDSERAIELAASALKEVRRLSRALRPSVLDDLGLEAGLRWLVRTTGEASKIDIELEWPDAGAALDKQSETLVFRIVQEALTNAVKHAGASRVRVVASREHAVLRVSITDNGCGFDAAGVLAASEQGFGTRGMRDRAELFGGRLRIESAPDEGASVVLDLPVAGE